MDGHGLVMVAAQVAGVAIGRIRLRCVADLTKASLHGFIGEAIEPRSVVKTDGLNAYRGMAGYRHEPMVIGKRKASENDLLPRSIRWCRC